MGIHGTDPTDRAFARFAERRDPDDVAFVFDRTAPRLMLVAMHLVGDAAAAEDLVQSTFLDAIRCAERFERGAPVMPWLLTILTRHAARLRRDRGRSTERAEGVDPDRIVDGRQGPVEELAEREVVERIAAAVETLAKPYREVLALRLVHGLRPVDIARSLDRPVGTVHAQLHRGVEMVRKALPKGLAAPVALLACQDRGLAAVRVVVLAAAEALTPLPFVLSAGGALMRKLIVVLGALLACSVLGVLWLLGLGDPPAEAGSVGELRAAVGTRPVETARDDLPVSPQQNAGRVEVPASERASSTALGSLLVRIRWRESGEPAPSVPVDVTLLDGTDPMFGALRAATDVGGELLLESLLPGSYWYVIHELIGGEVDVEPGKRATVEATLPAGIAADVEVVYPDGSPAAGAEVWLYRGVQFGRMPFAPDFQSGRQVAITDAAGRATLRGLDLAGQRVEAGGSHTTRWCAPWVGARLAGHVGSDLHGIDPLSEQPLRKIVLRLGEDPCILDGLVVDEKGETVAGALVEVQPPADRLTRQDDERALHRFAIVTKTDGYGRFSIETAAWGPVVVRVRAPAHAPYEESVQLDATGSPVRMTIRMAPGATLVGTVRTDRAEPVPGAGVSIAGRRVRVGPSGAFRIDALPVGRFDCRADADGFRTSSEVVDLEAGATARLDLVVERLVILRGVVADERGGRLAGWHVRAEAGDDRDGGEGSRRIDDTRTRTCDPNGEFELEVVAGRGYVLSVREPETVGLIDFPELGAVCGEGEKIRLEVADDRRATAAIAGYLLGEGGSPFAGARFEIERRGSYWSPAVDYDPATGRFVLGRIPPGPCALRIASVERAFPTFGAGPFELKPRATIELGRLVPPAVGTLDIRVDTGAGVDLAGAQVDLVRADGTGSISRPLSENDSRIRMDVKVGSYRVRLWGDAILSLERQAEVEDGAITEILLRPSPGRRREIVLTLPEGEESAVIELRAPDGSVVYSEKLSADQPTISRYPVIGIGRLVVEAVGASGKRYAGQVTVADLDELGTLHPVLHAVQ